MVINIYIRTYKFKVLHLVLNENNEEKEDFNYYHRLLKHLTGKLFSGSQRIKMSSQVRRI